MAPPFVVSEAYKKENERLALWVAQKYDELDKSSEKRQVTHETSACEFLRRVKVIVKRGNITVPLWVFGSFQFVIEARTRASHFFISYNSKQPHPDPKVEESNQGHRFFIECLKEAYELLRGQPYHSSKDDSDQDARDGTGNESKHYVHQNRFSVLQDNESQAENTDRSPSPTTQDHRAKREEERDSSSSKLEAESDCIVDDDDGVGLEYLMATIALFQDFQSLRCFLVDVWRAVMAENKLNFAIAGAMSNIAIATLKRTESAISQKFPDRDSYEDFVKVAMPSFDSGEPIPVPHMIATANNGIIECDANEMWLIYAYQDFIAFLRDFWLRKNGQCSAEFARQVKNWDPKFDLTHANREERRRWRNTYTVKWLYDLVNVFSSLCEERHPPNGAKWDARKADWSFVGGRDGSRHLFGLDEFARFACLVAWKTEGRECIKYIKPHHILQLQIIVDSMSVSRGWSEELIPTKVHIPAEHTPDSTPRQHLGGILDSGDMEPIFRYLNSSEDLIKQLKDRDDKYDNFGYSKHSKIIQTQTRRLRNLLGLKPQESDMIESRHVRNTRKRRGILWEQSPLLCGLGLMEALEIVFGIGTLVLNQIPEPLLGISLRNMLVETNYIENPGHPSSSLEESFTGLSCSQSTGPTQDFAGALRRWIRRISDNGSKALRRELEPESADILAILENGRKRNTIFTTTGMANATLYRLFDWDV